MKDNRYWRWGVVFTVLIMLSILFGFSVQRESNVCMGVPVLKNSEYETLGESVFEDLSSDLFHNGQLAAIDIKDSVIYISQNITAETQIADLSGLLSVEKSGYSLAFAPDAAFRDLHLAVTSGHRFELIIFTPLDKVVKYNVVFTTLPLLRMEGTVVGKDDEDRDLLEGTLCLWTPQDPDTDKYSCKTSYVQWNLRGHSTSHFPKKSVKLTLKDSKGNNRDISLIGMGEDDDWILNAMVVDNVKVREMLTTNLWNELTATTGDYKMAAMEYVEVVCNGEYSGLYFLQRRLDDKYLQLDENQVLVRGESQYTTDETQLADAIEVLEKIHLKTDYSSIVYANWIDINFFVEFIQGIDNTGRNYFYNNMAYIVTFEEEGASVRYLLWDTDMTYGIWLNPQGQFIYVKTYAAEEYQEGAHRVEMSGLRSNPEIVNMQTWRWQELRRGVFSDENICSVVDRLVAETENSGALDREKRKWGLHHDEDTVEDLKEYIQKRLAILDSVYIP